MGWRVQQYVICLGCVGYYFTHCRSGGGCSLENAGSQRVKSIGRYFYTGQQVKEGARRVVMVGRDEEVSELLEIQT